MSDAIERFFAAWGEPDADTRAQTLRETLSPDISYVDPRTPDAITNRDALIAYVAMYTQYAPGATARVVCLSNTQNMYRATVEFGMSDGMKQVGQYFIELDAESRASRLTGFVGLGEPE